MVVSQKELADRFILVPRPSEEQVYYNTVKSNNIITTNNSIEDSLNNFRVRFLHKNNYFISRRYTIFVKLYVQSREAYTFYETLNNFSESENLLSQIQLGFFEVSSVDIQRIYFNYSDLFPDEQHPYAANCILFISPMDDGNLALLLGTGDWKYIDLNEDRVPREGPWGLIPRICGDCTVLGNNTPPSFWEE